MSPFDDDVSDMDRRRHTAALGDDVAEALLAGRAVPAEADLKQLLTLLRATAAAPPPVPSAALAAVLAAGFEPLPGTTVAPSSAGWRRWGPLVAFAATVAITGATGATAANALPSPVQTAVADAVEALTPLDVPRPAADPDVDPSDRRPPSEAGTTGTSTEEQDSPGTTSGPDDELTGNVDDDDMVTDDNIDADSSGPGSGQSADDDDDRSSPGQDDDGAGTSTPDADEPDSYERGSGGRESGGTGSSRLEGVQPDSNSSGHSSDAPDDALVEEGETNTDPDAPHDDPQD